jgi:hypothetical protein
VETLFGMTLTVSHPRETALHVDLDDPFFFDHPLDHVPGMLLVTGLLDLARPLAGGDRVALSLAFTAVCELDEPVTLHAAPHTIALSGEVGGWAVRAVQRGRAVCEGLVSGYRVHPPEITAVPAGSPARPVDQRLVHRARAENVLLGEPGRIGEEYRFPVLRPAPGTFLSADGYRAEALIESGRQMSTMLAHTVAGHPLGTRMLWSTVEADLPWSLASETVPALLCRPEPAKGRRMHYRATLVGAGAGEFHGTLGYGCAAVSAASFERFRSAGRAA